MFKKLTAMTLALVMALSLFAGCRQSRHDPSALAQNSQLTEEKKQALALAYETKWKEEPAWFDSAQQTDGFRYYGTYSGYDIICKPSSFAVFSCVVIGDAYFLDSNFFELYAYQDGTFVPLKKAYEDGLVDSAAIEAVVQQHNLCAEFLPEDDGTVPTLTEEQMKKIDRVYNNQDFWFGQQELYGMRYLCQSGKKYIVHVKSNLTSIMNETIADVKFEDGTAGTLYVYAKGTLVELREAYANGIVSKETVEKAGQFFNLYKEAETEIIAYLYQYQ